jgi:hypothetical protein
MGQLRGDPPIELARGGEISNSRIRALTREMGEGWEVWLEKPMPREQEEMPSAIEETAPAELPEEPVNEIRYPFNPGGPL